MIKDFFKNIFNKENTDRKGYSRVKLFNGYSPVHMDYPSNSYDRLIYRACIDCIARQVAKLTPTVKLFNKDKFYRNLTYLLNYKPNAYMNRFDFFYKIISMLLDKNNVFIYVQVKDNAIAGLYPINYSEIEFVEYDNNIFGHFRFMRGFEVFIPYENLIHLRRHYNDNELYGSTQTELLAPIFRVLNAIDSGMINAVEASGQLRGLIHYNGVLNDADLENKRKEFVKNYVSADGDGIGIIDSKTTFETVKIEPITIDFEQQKEVLNNFSYYFGVSEKILTGSADENEYNSFYEMVIEPLLVQLSLEFTNKIFSKNEIEQGNEIYLTANKMLFASVQTKTTLAKELMPTGAFSINEIRDIYGYNPISDDIGDRHIISLNYIDLANANKYQVGENEGVKKDET